MKNKVESDEGLKNLVYTHFKGWNEWALLTYAKYWVNVATLQKRLVDLWYNLWSYWVNWNWVDGDFGTLTFVSIIDVQKSLGLEPTWIANVDLLKFLFPKVFKSLNAKLGRWVNETNNYLEERIASYREWLEEGKKGIIQNTKREIKEVKNKVVKSKTSRKVEKPESVEKRRVVKIKGKRLANFLAKKWYPTYKDWPSCWANVWEALIDFWIEWLPTWWRDWYTWVKILDNNPNFVKKAISDPKEALPGWILVYNRGKWRWVRAEYGHVEIVAKDWYWYWWNPKSHPWWSTLAWFTGYVYYPRA
jgi:hypothetical protein